METSRAFAARAASGERVSSRDALEDDDAWRANAVEDFERVRREGAQRARTEERGAGASSDDGDDFLVLSEARRGGKRLGEDVRGARGWTRGRRPRRRPSVVGEVSARGTRMERRAEDGVDARRSRRPPRETRARRTPSARASTARARLRGTHRIG